MFLRMLLTDDAHLRTALPDRQTYTWDPHVHVTSRGNGNLWPQHLCLAQMQVIVCSYHLLSPYCVSGAKLVLYTSCNLCKIGHFISILHGQTENVRNN
uniref:G-patch domain containing 2 like n=1 Tax=Rhinolophus ferrumequinum TaxID=59479 RepID=A0A671DRK5_RHIFE